MAPEAEFKKGFLISPQYFNQWPFLSMTKTICNGCLEETLCTIGRIAVPLTVKELWASPNIGYSFPKILEVALCADCKKAYEADFQFILS
jgi:hypothetical protein